MKKYIRPAISFIFCTASPLHLREFASGFHDLICLLDGGKHETTPLELIVIVPQDFSAPLQLPSPAHRLLTTRFLQTRWGARNTSRNEGFRAASGRWIYFLDQDVRLPSQETPFTKVIRELVLTNRYDDFDLLTGPYRNEKRSSYWGCQYNSLSNLWLENSHAGLRALAGNVLLRKAAFAQPPFDETLMAGGEEIALAAQVQKKGGHALILSELAIDHRADHTLALFWRRQRTHALAKRKLRRLANSDAERTRYSAPLLRRLLKQPAVWPACAITLTAQLLPQRELSASC